MGMTGATFEGASNGVEHPAANVRRCHLPDCVATRSPGGPQFARHSIGLGPARWHASQTSPQTVAASGSLTESASSGRTTPVATSALTASAKRFWYCSEVP